MNDLPKRLKEIFDRKQVTTSDMGKGGNDYGKGLEEYWTVLLSDQAMIAQFDEHVIPTTESDDYYYFYAIVNKEFIDGHGKITNIETTRSIPRTDRGGPPKTDILVTYIYEDDYRHVVKYSSKQSTVRNVACGQHTVEEMFEHCDITDNRLQDLWKKFQIDGSAKNFTSSEKEYLDKTMPDYTERIWTYFLSGNSNPDCDDIRVANRIIMVNVDKKTGSIKKFGVYTINEYIDSHLYSEKVLKDGTVMRKRRTSGFGTGVSFTRASKSFQKNIQVKLPAV